MNPEFTHNPALSAIPDLQTGLEILERLPLGNPRQAQNELNHFFDSLSHSPPPAEVCLDLLEHSREALCFVEEDFARRYVNKPLPLGDAEEDDFQRVIVSWRKAANAYARCAQLLDAATADASTARVLHRCIYYAGMIMVEHHRARRELPQGLWLELHAYYASAEAAGVETQAVPDALDPLERSTSCSAAYLGLLLSELASPYSLSIRNQNLVRNWANNWSPLLSLHAAAPGEPLPAFVIDLKRDAGLQATADCLQTEQLRRLDTSRLAMQMNHVRQQLKQNVAPAQIGLGETCTAGQCRRMLEHLSKPWLQVRAPRKFRRHATSGIARVCTGFEAMYFCISGKEFVQPENARNYSRQEFERLFAFRSMDDPAQQLHVYQDQPDFSVDQWEVVNQSANGFRLMRSIAGKKMAHGQLLATCPSDSVAFLLAQTNWLMQERGGGLIAGIAALPGIPQAVLARPIVRGGAHTEIYSRAFLLPAVPAIGSEPSLVIPQGWYRRERIIEIHADTKWCAELKHVLDDGPDFERVSFVVA
jgi:hypothetical protein